MSIIEVPQKKKSERVFENDMISVIQARLAMQETTTSTKSDCDAGAVAQLECQVPLLSRIMSAVLGGLSELSRLSSNMAQGTPFLPLFLLLQGIVEHIENMQELDHTTKQLLEFVRGEILFLRELFEMPSEHLSGGTVSLLDKREIIMANARKWLEGRMERNWLQRFVYIKRDSRSVRKFENEMRSNAIQLVIRTTVEISGQCGYTRTALDRMLEPLQDIGQIVPILQSIVARPALFQTLPSPRITSSIPSVEIHELTEPENLITRQMWRWPGIRVELTICQMKTRRGTFLVKRFRGPGSIRAQQQELKAALTVFTSQLLHPAYQIDDPAIDPSIIYECPQGASYIPFAVLWRRTLLQNPVLALRLLSQLPVFWDSWRQRTELVPFSESRARQWIQDYLIVDERILERDDSRYFIYGGEIVSCLRASEVPSTEWNRQQLALLGALWDTMDVDEIYMDCICRLISSTFHPSMARLRLHLYLREDSVEDVMQLAGQLGLLPERPQLRINGVEKNLGVDSVHLDSEGLYWIMHQFYDDEIGCWRYEQYSYDLTNQTGEWGQQCGCPFEKHKERVMREEITTFESWCP